LRHRLRAALFAPAEQFQKESREHILVVLGADFEIPVNIPQALIAALPSGLSNP
jgi:hypothetical protein